MARTREERQHAAAVAAGLNVLDDTLQTWRDHLEELRGFTVQIPGEPPQISHEAFEEALAEVKKRLETLHVRDRNALIACLHIQELEGDRERLIQSLTEHDHSN